MVVRYKGLFVTVLISAVLGFYVGRIWKKKLVKDIAISQEVLAHTDRIIPVAVIGSGPAGLSAALYASRFNLYTIVFEGKRPGGQLMGTTDVENWPGMGRELGPKIIEKLKRQAESFGAICVPASVEKIEVRKWPYKLSLDDGTEAYALSIILAMGASPVELGVPGERENWGNGVTSCAVCDAPFFRDKEVVVVGGGDAAAEEALQLAAHAKKITVLVRGDKMRASFAMQQRLKAYDKITLRYQTQVRQILGDGTKVTGVTLVSQGKEEEQKIDGVFLAIGHTPNTQLVREWLACDAQGYVMVVPQRQKTSQPGVFAAGDVADHFYRQAGIASGDGIKAAIDAADFLRHHGLDEKSLSVYEEQFFVPPSQTTGELPLMGSVKEFDELIESAKVPIVVDFFTPTCPTCLQLMPHVAGVAQGFGDAMKAVKVNGDTLPQLMDRYTITSVPTVVIFKDGMLVARSSSLSSRRDIQQLIAQVVE
jgi:thioredoxin reductase (NADPH)